MSSFVLDKEAFVRRVKRLYTEWRVSLSAGRRSACFWGRRSTGEHVESLQTGHDNGRLGDVVKLSTHRPGCVGKSGLLHSNLGLFVLRRLPASDTMTRSGIWTAS